MTPRVDWAKISPEAQKAMRAVQAHVHDSGLEPSLIQLVDVRASQINGCAY